MRPVRFAVVLWVLGFVGIPGNAKPPVVGLGAHPKADEHFAIGEYRLAARSYRAVMDRDPTDLRAAFGLARSLAALDDCGEPLGLLRGLRKSPEWSAEMAVLEGACRSAMGDLAGAEAAFGETLAMGGEPRGVLARLAEVRLVAGDVEGFEGALRALEREPDTEAVVAVLRVQEAVERDLADVDERILLAWRALADRPRGNLDADLMALDGRRWLDLGELDAAFAAFTEAVRIARRDPTIAAWSIECSRRSGITSRAEAALQREGIRRARGALLDSVRARIQVDLGDIDGAIVTLEALGDTDHPELLASWWYVARARGDSAETRRWAARWAAASTGRGSLEALVPLGKL